MPPVLIIQNCEAETAGTTLDYLRERGLAHSVVRTYRGEKLPEVKSVGAVINLACPISITQYHEHDFLKKLHAFVSEAVRREVPYLGICFGAQMLAQLLGGWVGPNRVKEIGTYTIRLTAEGTEDPLLAGFDRSFSVFHWHGDTFDVAAGASLLAEGDDCRNQAFRKGSLVGLLFHLETTPDKVARWCEVYAEELAEVGKSRESVVNEYAKVFERTRQLNFRLLDNFFNLFVDRQ